VKSVFPVFVPQTHTCLVVTQTVLSKCNRDAGSGRMYQDVQEQVGLDSYQGLLACFCLLKLQLLLFQLELMV